MTDDLTPMPSTDRDPADPAADAPTGRTSANLAPPRPEYKGAELDAARGPGLGCFWFQAIVLGFFLVLIPIGVSLNWPFEVLAALLFVALGLLLFVGQTLIFLLRLVAADRRDAGRRRPLASVTPTVGQLEDALLETTSRDESATPGGATGAASPGGIAAAPDDDAPPAAEPGPGSVRE